MPSSRRKRSLAARIFAAVCVSVGLHGLILLGIRLAPVTIPTPTAPADPTQVAQDYMPLGLDNESAQAAPSPKRTDSDVTQASFSVRMVDPPPVKMGSAAPPAIFVNPGGTTVGAGHSGAAVGEGNGAGGGDRPCALPVGKDARTILYVMDRSISMGFHGALARARREVLAGLRQLPPTARYQIIAYNRTAEPLSIDGRSGLLSPDENTLRQVTETVSALRAAGGTDDAGALRRGLAFHPDVLYFITDADDLAPDDVRTATRLNDHHTVIHTIQVSFDSGRADGPLQKLAAENGGVYLRLDPEE
jgi:hypothetical protein